MSKMHGPDKDVNLCALGVKGSITLAELYKIIYDRLDYATRNKTYVWHIDVEAVTQQAMVEVRKKLGLYKDELDARWTADNVAKTDAEGSHPPQAVEYEVGQVWDFREKQWRVERVDTAPTDQPPMSAPQNCNRWIQTHKPQQAYPRTCERCGLGPCPFVR